MEGANAAMVGDTLFESGVIKIQRGRQYVLTRSEKHALRGLARDASDEDSDGDDELSFAEQALKCARVETTYLTEAVAPTSNEVERLFSQARATIGLQRHNLQPELLEAILFLKVNGSYWNAKLVHGAIERQEE
jgi:hypothetical protein